MHIDDSSNIHKTEVSPEDRGLLDKLYNVINGSERPVLLGREGANVQFPEPVFHMLVEIVRQMRKGNAVSVIPSNSELTTQAAADQLGVSRPHLVKLLEDGKIDYHMCGSHRRVYHSDLIAYKEARDRERSESLDRLTKLSTEVGLYEASEGYTGED